MLVRPDGIGGAFYALRDALLRRIAKARGIIVPSLLADVRVDETEVALLDEVEAEAPAATGLAPEWAAQHESGQPPDDALLVVRGLEVAYDKAKVLFGVDFHVSRGEIVALLGTNGAGKSTLLSAICGLVKPAAGTVTFDGQDITGANPTETVARGIAMMPGGKGVFPTLTVAENLQLAGWLFVKDPEYVRTATEQVLEFFPILRERWDQRAGNLSGGEQQMLTLGQAFLAKPELLMIDELSLGLAPIIVEQLLGIVRAIHDSGTTIVLVEQSVNVAITLAERAVFLEKGEVRFNGPTAELLERPELLRAVFLEGAATKRTEQLAGVSANGMHRHFAGECEHCGHTHEVAIELREISAAFGGIRAVDDVSFSVAQGQIIGMIGPNGAGKTTVLDIISGFVAGEAGGRILLGGKDVTDLSPDQRALAGLGRSFQDARLFPSMTVRDTIATAFERHVSVPDPAGGVRVVARGDGLRARGQRQGRRAHRADAAPGVRRQVRRRAVDRHPPHRRPRVHARAQAVGAAARRAVVGHRPTRDRGARAGAARHPRQDRRRAHRHRARHAVDHHDLRRAGGPRARLGHRPRRAARRGQRPARRRGLSRHVRRGDQPVRRRRCEPSPAQALSAAGR